MEEGRASESQSQGRDGAQVARTVPQTSTNVTSQCDGSSQYECDTLMVLGAYLNESSSRGGYVGFIPIAHNYQLYFTEHLRLFAP